MITACLLYTVRVLCAWWVIAQIRSWLTVHKPQWSTLTIFYASVLVGAEITFIIDYAIFNKLVFNG